MSSIYMDRASLFNRIIMQLAFSIHQPVHVGAELEGTLKKFVRIYIDGKPMIYIPSESIKGVFRSIYTRIAKTYANKLVEDVVKKAITIHNKDTHTPLEEEKEELLKTARNWIISDIKFTSHSRIGELSNDEIIDMYMSYHCPICSLFGSRNLTSKIIFEDGTFKYEPKIDIYTSTSIEREKRIVKEGHLYRLEYIAPDPNNRLYIKAIINNLAINSLENEILKQLLLYIKINGLTIGGSKSRGYGKLKLDEKESKIIYMQFKTSPKTIDEAISNINQLLQREGYIKILTIDEYLASKV